ncbi:MAG: hypothetical protein ACREFY_16135 [Acetobacteraceae bacterium]
MAAACKIKNIPAARWTPNLPFAGAAGMTPAQAGGSPPSTGLYLLLFAFGAAMQLLASRGSLALVWHGGLVDPDSYMRLVRIEQGLKLGHLVNAVVGRDDSGATLVIEWSRLFDAGLVALAAPLAPWLGWHKALHVAGVASAPLAAGLLGVGIGFAVAPLAERRWLWIAAALTPLLDGIRGFEPLGVIHYHIIMLVPVAAAAGFALRAAGGGPASTPRRGDGFAAGVAGGLAIWVMPETMPFVLLVFLGLGWCWMFRPIGRAVAAGGAGFLATLTFGLWCDPPAGGLWAPEIDRISIVYATLGLAVAGVGLWLAVLDGGRLIPAASLADRYARGVGVAAARAIKNTPAARRTPNLPFAGTAGMAPARRRALGLGGALGGFAVWLAAFPTVALGPYALLPPEQMRLFFGEMVETQPVHGAGSAAMLLGPGLFALVVALVRAWHTRRAPAASGAWLIAAAGALLGSALTARFLLFAPFPAALAAALLPVALTGASRRFEAAPNRAAAARIGLVAALLIAPYAVPAFGAVFAGRHTARPKTVGPSCAMTHIAALLAPAAGQIVLSRVGEVPELLYRSRIVAVGSLYQHGVAGYLRDRAAWRAPAGQREPPAVRATGARFVLFCPRSTPYALAQGAPADALWFVLSAGHAPPWLRLVGTLPDTGFRLYRIVPRAGR